MICQGGDPDQVRRVLQGGWASVVCVFLNKDWIYSDSQLLLYPPLLPLSSLPSSTLLQLLASAHFYKTLQHKNPQALKSCPVEEGGAWGEETVGRNILLFTPLNHSIRSRRRRWRGGYIVSDGPAD